MMQVIKIGGAALNDRSWLDEFAATVAAPLGNVQRLIVHGGGPDITALSEKLGLTTDWHHGRRITSDAALDVTSMVLNGRINKRIVRALAAHGVDALGLSGEDGGAIVGRLTEQGQLGRVGDVISVRVGLFKLLLEAGLMPVVSPVSIGTDGGALNINADEVATAVAAEMNADELLFITDVDGVRVDGERAPHLSDSVAQQLVLTGVATGGMAVKLRAAVLALHAGVMRVRIGSIEMLWNPQAGTALNGKELAWK